MWKILGTDAMYVEIPDVWKKRMLELSGELAEDAAKAEKFKDIVARSEITYLMNGTTEEHTFFIRVPDEITPEEIQILADVSLDVLKKCGVPCISVEDTVQRYQVVISNWHEPEIIGKNKTPGMSSGEVFKPIIQCLDGPGKPNSALNNQFF